MTCPDRINVAAYLLYALEQPEIGRMREHLPECPDCQAEYDELRDPTILLDTVTPSDVEDIVAPAEVAEHLRDVLITRAARRRRRTRHRVLGTAAAAALLVAGIATGVAVISRPPPVAHSATMYTSDPHTHVYASATLTSRSWVPRSRSGSAV
jgi:anti-sigma factor RsiW